MKIQKLENTEISYFKKANSHHSYKAFQIVSNINLVFKF